MDFGIAGKIAFVSGGSKGVGRRVSEMLAREGCHVIVAARSQDAINETVAAIRKEGGSAIGVAVDLTTKEGVTQAMEAGRKAFGGMPDIALNNVNGPAPVYGLLDVQPEDFEKVFRTFNLSAVHLAQAVLPHMKEKGWGRLIGTSSESPKEPTKDLKHVMPTAARATVITLNKSLADEYGPYGITVNTIGTGYIGSERMYEIMGNIAENRGMTLEEMVAPQIPLRRIGKPEEMAAVIVFLCSQQAAYINGTLVQVEGGMNHCAW